MNCNEIRELISSMLDHELSAEDSAVVTEHLAECLECMRVFEAFHAISVSLEELEDVPEGFTEAVMHKIKTTAPVKKRRPGYLRIASLAACLALVIFTGSQFVTSHRHSDDRNIQDTAQYARVTHQTPKPKPTPTPTPAATAEIVVGSEDGQTPAPDSGASPTEHATVSENDEATITPTPAVTPTPVVTPTPEASPVVTATPRPTATPQPSPVYIPAALNSLSDLLYVAEDADFDLFTQQPDYELTAQDVNGMDVKLLVWLDGERIYCKNLVEGTAWYAVGTAETLKALVEELPVSSPVPSPEADEQDETEE